MIFCLRRPLAGANENYNEGAGMPARQGGKIQSKHPKMYTLFGSTIFKVVCSNSTDFVPQTGYKLFKPSDQ
jgi:hypothetical protein